MEKENNSDIFSVNANENTDDLSFLAETAVLEKLAEGEKSEPVQDLTETRVFEKLTEDQNDDAMSDTGTLEKITDGESGNDEKKSGFRSSALKEVLLFFRDLAVCLAIVLVVVNFILRPIQVKGSSMYPTLTSGSLGVSNLLGYNMDGIKRFDIVIIYLEEKNEYLVKRCIGMPNETISYSNDVLYINGEPMEEDFLDEEYSSGFNIFTADMEEVKLGEDEYFCLGDNRPRSTDSRFYGPFRRDQIVSKGAFIFFPFSSFGGVTW